QFAFYADFRNNGLERVAYTADRLQHPEQRAAILDLLQAADLASPTSSGLNRIRKSPNGSSGRYASSIDSR
ncbi:MAG: hypothetical protein OXG35_08600, partial [Acidobacteria bacterium]|nr:hypothetical protein [Acidobacteriota bacterium]